MPVWRIAPIAEEPSCTLTSWNVFETERQERHLCGYALESREGRVTSAIATFDPEQASAATRSGRIYELRGRPGANADAEYVKATWLRVNASTEHRDVTEEFWASINACRSTKASKR